MKCRHFLLGIILSLLLISYPVFQCEEVSNVQVVSEPNYDEIYEAGSYPVVLEYEDANGEKTTKTLYITLKYQRTVENKEYHEFIDAHDVVLKKGELASLSDEQILYLIKAKAWSDLDNTMLQVHIASMTKVKGTTDYYQVVLSTAKGTTTTIHVFEVENNYTSSLPQYFDYFSNSNMTYNIAAVTSGLIVVVPFIIFIFSFRKVEKELESLFILFFQKKETDKK